MTYISGRRKYIGDGMEKKGVQVCVTQLTEIINLSQQPKPAWGLINIFPYNTYTYIHAKRGHVTNYCRCSSSVLVYIHCCTNIPCMHTTPSKQFRRGPARSITRRTPACTGAARRCSGSGAGRRSGG